MKINGILAAALLSLLVSACSGEKATSESPATEEETVEVEETDETDEYVPDTVAICNDDPASSSSNNWDSVLDEYERYCEKLATLSKKAQSGDISCMAEYASTLEQAQKVANKLENAEGDLTPAQMTRLSKIAAKMAQSAM